MWASGLFQQCSVMVCVSAAAAAATRAEAAAEGQAGEREREREREGRMNEGGREEKRRRRRRKDTAATADLNKIGMTITHEGENTVSLCCLETHKHTHLTCKNAYPASSDHQPHATHCSLCPDWLMQNQGRALNTQDSWSRKIWINDQIQQKKNVYKEEGQSDSWAIRLQLLHSWPTKLSAAVCERGNMRLERVKKERKGKRKCSCVVTVSVGPVCCSVQSLPLQRAESRNRRHRSQYSRD